MSDSDELEVKSPSVEDSDGARDALREWEYRGEDAHERFRLVELKIVQKNVRRIEDGIAVENGNDDDVPDGQFTRFRPTPRSGQGTERTRRGFVISFDKE